MTTPSTHTVAARVVAWHNRHPLARRIDASQVHSIGEVRLPFVSATAVSASAVIGGAASADAVHTQLQPGAPLPAATGPSLAQALAARGARATADAHAIPGLEVQTLQPDDSPAAAPALDLGLDDDGDGEAALVIPLLDGEDPPAADDAALAADAGTVASTATPAAPAAPNARTAATTSATTSATTAAPADVPPAAPPAAPAAAHPAPAGGLLQALRRLFSGRQDGLPPLRAAFSRDFIWPLRPAQVARWAQRHGQAQPLAPADWPQRCVDTDRARLARLRQQGRAHDVPLHVLTAAIGVGDRRIRVLLGADGNVLGPRAYSRSRVGGAAAVLCLGLMGAGWGLRPLQAPPAADQPAAQAAPAASSTVAPVTVSASASAASKAHTDTHASTPASAPAIGPPPLAHAASATAPDNSASAPAADIRPALSETQKETARAQSALLRGEAPAATAPQPGDGPVYAVISRASRQHDTAAGNLALMRAAAERLGSDAPGHRELLESQGEWRAAWWPFTTMVDAERARVMLIGKGLKAEVVSF